MTDADGIEFWVYKNARNEVKAYELLPLHKEDGLFFIYDIRSEYEKTFTVDNIIKNDFSTWGDAEKFAQEEQKKYTIKPKQDRSHFKYKKDGDIVISITGTIEGYSRKELTKLANDNGFHVTGSKDSKSAQYLLCGKIKGKNTGKLTNAIERGIPRISGTENIESFLKHGILPEPE